MGIELHEIKEYLDKFSEYLRVISYVDISLENVSEQLEEIKDLLKKILRKMK